MISDIAIRGVRNCRFPPARARSTVPVFIPAISLAEPYIALMHKGEMSGPG